MNVKEIVEKYLQDNKFDGLTGGTNFCCCSIEDLMPCGGMDKDISECVPGYKIKCPIPEECGCESNHISSEKIN
jgi:hypothetical protein